MTPAIFFIWSKNTLLGLPGPPFPSTFPSMMVFISFILVQDGETSCSFYFPQTSKDQCLTIQYQIYGKH